MDKKIAAIANAASAPTENDDPTKTQLITDKQGALLLSCSTATWWRRVADGTMPQPLRIGSMTRWRLREVTDAIERIASARADD